MDTRSYLAGKFIEVSLEEVQTTKLLLLYSNEKKILGNIFLKIKHAYDEFMTGVVIGVCY